VRDVVGGPNCVSLGNFLVDLLGKLGKLLPSVDPAQSCLGIINTDRRAKRNPYSALLLDESTHHVSHISSRAAF
jgi:hypothetical protein